MKKLSLVLILFSLSTQLKAQSKFWIDSGAVWHYDYGLFYGGFHKLKYEKDTVIQGHNCQHLNDSTYTFFPQPNNTITFGYATATSYYTYTNGDTVFYLKNGEFLTLFNFAAQVGHTWVIDKSNPSGLSCDTISTAKVIQKDSIQINSEWYRTIKLEALPGSFSGIRGGMVVEKFGTIGPGFLFPLGISCDSSAIVDFDLYNFKCFEDNSFPLYNPSGDECEYLLNHQSIKEQHDFSFEIFPNPSENILNINFSNSVPESITIFNMEGKVVYTYTPNIPNTQLNLSHLEKGIYFVKCIDRKKGFAVKKWVKI